MMDPSEITTSKIALANAQTNPREATGEHLSDTGNAMPGSSKRGGLRDKTPPREITIGETDRTKKSTTELMSRSITRRSLGLNMILGLGGLHSTRGLTDRLRTSPSPRRFFTPVVLQPNAVPPKLWGKWVYHNQGNAIDTIIERLELDFNRDGTGFIYYSNNDTEYQTRYEAVEFDQYTTGNWITNGQQLIFTGSGNSSYDNTCNPALNYNRNISGRLVFSSYEVSGDTMRVDTWPALRLTTIDSPTNPQAPLHNALFTKTVSSRSGSWGNWENLGAYAIDGCAVASWAPNRLDVFVVGGDRALYHRAWDGSAWSSDWGRFNSYCVGTPAAVSWGPNRVDVFVIGGDRQCYHLYWDGHSWNGWEALGGQCEYGVAASSWATNQLDVFVTGTDQAIWRRSWTGAAWTGWQKVNSGTISAPAAVAYAQNGVDIACIGPDHDLYVNNDSGSGFGGWLNTGGYCVDGVAAASWGPDRLDLFAIGEDGAVWQRPWEGSFGNWVSLGGLTTYGPAAIARAPNVLNLFVIGLDHALYHKGFA